MDKVTLLNVRELAELIQSGTLDIRDHVSGVLERVRSLNSSLNCYITVVEDGPAIRRAEDLQRLIDAGRYLGPLHGITLAVKDNTRVDGFPTTAGSMALNELELPSVASPVASVLTEKGSVIVGKANLYELAAGGISKQYGDVRNPLNPDKSAGASSSGSAAAVAAGLADVATGTDVGGSVRVPAATCGIVGLKPTYGLVPIDGVIPGSYDMDHVGFLGRDVYGVTALLHSSTRGRSGSLSPARLEEGVKGLNIGVPADLEDEPLDRVLLDRIQQGIQRFQELGADVHSIRLPDRSQVRTVMLTIHAAEVAEHHHGVLRSRLDKLSNGTRTLLLAGALIDAPSYIRAQRVRRQIQEYMWSLYERIDLILTPTIPVSSWSHGATEVVINGQEENFLTAITRYTPLYNLTGQPAVALPCGPDEEGMPLSIQIAGRPYEDHIVLRAARAYEKAETT